MAVGKPAAGVSSSQRCGTDPPALTRAAGGGGTSADSNRSALPGSSAALDAIKVWKVQSQKSQEGGQGDFRAPF